MRIAFPSGTRNLPTDRNPLTIKQGGSQVATGLVTLTMTTYTVPALRRAELVVTISGIVQVAQAAGQNGLVAVTVTGQAASSPAIRFLGGAPIQTADWRQTGTIYLAAGDQVQTQVLNAAGVGSIVADGAAFIVEYDA